MRFWIAKSILEVKSVLLLKKLFQKELLLCTPPNKNYLSLSHSLQNGSLLVVVPLILYNSIHYHTKKTSVAVVPVPVPSANGHVQEVVVLVELFVFVVQKRRKKDKKRFKKRVKEGKRLEKRGQFRSKGEKFRDRFKKGEVFKVRFNGLPIQTRISVGIPW